MNTVERLVRTACAVGLENLPRRVWQVLGNAVGLRRWRSPGGELSREQMRLQFDPAYDPSEAADWWRRRAKRFFVDPDRLPAVAAALRDLNLSAQVGGTTSADSARQCSEGPRGLKLDPRGEILIPSGPAAQHALAPAIEGEGSAARRLGQGGMPFFGHHDVHTGWPVDFQHDPVNGVDWPTGRHWSRYAHFDPDLADIKCVWEASRFSIAYQLAREYALDSQEATADLFRQLCRTWDRQNPYGLTVQWSCGQEGTFRAMAWLFGASVLLDKLATTPDLLHRMTELFLYTGRHIDRNINYARSQKNNHAISEAVMLWTIGLLFPEFRAAAKWRNKGRRILAAEVARQIYDDGSYVQHSMNYHRVMTDDLLWAVRLGELCDATLPDVVRDRLSRAHHWLLEMMDPESGGVANYGANDGAQVLPLSACDYRDYRPVVQATHYLLYRKRCLPPGPWDEKALWMFGPEAIDAPHESPVRAAAYSAPAGGYYVLRGSGSWAMLRCHTYRDRPGQADMLHLDLWHRGQNVLRDAGSYSYNCAPPWQGYFLSTAAHNTVQVDAVDQMIKGPRFLWFRWTRARANRFAASADGRVGYFEGEHYGYTRLQGRVVHRRCVCRIDDTYVIVDDVLGTGVHDVRLRWRLGPLPWRRDGDTYRSDASDEPLMMKIAAADSLSKRLAQGEDSDTPEGWESLYYAEKTPVTTLIVSGETELPTRLVTIVGPEHAMVAPVIDASTFHPSGSLRLTGVDSDVADEIDRLCGGRMSAS